MNIPNREEHEQEFVDSLLKLLYKTDVQQAQSLVTAGMQKLDSASTSSINSASKKDATSSVPIPIRWLVGFSFAAVVLLGIAATLFRPNNAVAAVKRSIQQAFEDVGRHYQVATTFRVGEESVERSADLYVKGADCLAISGEGPLGLKPIWLGSKNGQAWVVPPVGPVMEGNTESLIRWVAHRDDIATPFLHVSTFLERMCDVYRLKYVPSQSVVLVNGVVADCEHIVGTLKRRDGNPDLPDLIALWADEETKLAVKVKADWLSPAGDFGRETVVIEWREEVALTDEFFTADEHGGKGRSRINLDKRASQ